MKQYTPEHIGKCAGCPKVNNYPLLGCTFGMRALTCDNLQSFRADVIKEARERCSPQILAIIEQSAANLDQLKNLSKPAPKKATIEPFLLRDMPASQLN